MAELTAPFVFKNDEKRIVYGPVLIPNEPDTDDDVVSAEKIEEVAHKFVEDYGNIDLQHSLNNVGRLVESYILPMDLQLDGNMEIPKGSWMMGVRVTDEDAWKSVKSGRLGGFSIMGIARRVFKSKEHEELIDKNKAYKRTTLADLGDEWIVNAVSLVDEPAVPKAKFLVIKSKNNSNDDSNIDNDKDIDNAINTNLDHEKEKESRIEADRGASGRVFDEQGEIIDHDGRNPTGTGTNTGGGGEERSTDAGGGPISNTDEKEEDSTEKSKESVMDKLMKKLGYISSDKAGRKISDANYRKLTQAREQLDILDDLLEDLLEIADGERAEPNDDDDDVAQNEKSKKGEKSMEEKDIEQLIEKKLEPMDAKLDDLIETFKASAKERNGDDLTNDGTRTREVGEGDDRENNGGQNRENPRTNEGTRTDEVGEGEGNNNNNNSTKSNDDFESNLEKEIEKLERYRPISKRIAGQDNLSEEEKKVESDRNAFGYKKRKKK